MARLVEMLRGVPARRAVATANVTAGQAEPEMDPGHAPSQALFTPRRCGREPARDRSSVDISLQTSGKSPAALAQDPVRRAPSPGPRSFDESAGAGSEVTVTPESHERARRFA